MNSSNFSFSNSDMAIMILCSSGNLENDIGLRFPSAFPKHISGSLNSQATNMEAGSWCGIGRQKMSCCGMAASESREAVRVLAVVSTDH